ncbi:MAG: PEP-CTERM sorting domain-containing protein, partial [Verrucomicrobiota bacterium]|nr:PEP-CTERM sorting domain-containing protein [Verrucomicrobiota bacterium]
NGVTAGGAGGAVTLNNAVSGSSGSVLVLGQQANGGTGGSARNGGTPGVGGAAISTLTNATNPVGGNLNAQLFARGGQGGLGVNADNTIYGANGANATATLVATNTTALTGTAEAIGGAGGGGLFGFTGTASTGGDATSAATGTISGNGPGIVNLVSDAFGGTGQFGGFNGAAQADATAAGRNGSLESQAGSLGGLVSTLGTNAIATVSGSAGTTAVTAATESRAAVGRPVPAMSAGNNLQAAAFATGLPSNADVNTLEAGHPNVSAALNPSNSTIFGFVDLATKSRSDAGGSSQIFDANAGFNLRANQIANPQQLDIGLLNGTLTAGSGGFQSLDFTIMVGGTTVESDHFTTLNSAISFFSDHVIDLGALQPVGNLAVNFDLQLTSTGGGDGFNGDLVFGNGLAVVPEPGTCSLLVLGACVLMFLGRRRRAGRLGV